MATTILGETVFDVDDIDGEADVLLLNCDLDHAQQGRFNDTLAVFDSDDAESDDDYLYNDDDDDDDDDDDLEADNDDLDADDDL